MERRQHIFLENKNLTFVRMSSFLRFNFGFSTGLFCLLLKISSKFLLDVVGVSNWMGSRDHFGTHLNPSGAIHGTGPKISTSVISSGGCCGAVGVDVIENRADDDGDCVAVGIDGVSTATVEF